MIKKFLFSLILSIFCFSLYSQDFDYSQIRDNFSPRDEGSINESKLIKYIENFCNSNDIEYKTEKIDNEDDIVTNSFNIEINIKGSSLVHEKFIVVCPLNTAILYQKDFDNSISVKIVLDLIKLCKSISFNKDLVFLFTGANERESPDYPGVKYFLQKNDELGKSFVTVIDILSNKNDIRFSGSVSGKPVPLDILKNYLKLTDESKLNIYFQRDEIYKSKFYLIPKDDYNSVFLDNDIQCVTFSNKEKTVNNDFIFDQDFQRRLTDFFFKWILLFDNVKFPIDADFHYQYINIFGFKIIISEIFQIILFLILIFMIIFVRFFFPRFQRLHYFLLIKGSPYFLILFVIYFIASFIQYLVFIPINNLSGNTRIFINYPILYFSNIFLISLLIILLFFELIKKLPFPKHSYLYVYGSLVFLGLNLIIFAFIDISISFVYLLALIAVTISQYSGRNFNLKFILYFLSSVPFVMLFVDLVSSGNMEVIKSLNPIALNLLFSIFTFPFILLALRVELFLRIKYKKIIKRSPLIVFLIIFIFIILSLLIVFSILYKPAREKVAAKLITEVNKESSHLLIESDRNTNEIFIDDGNSFKKINLRSGKMFVPVSLIKQPYKIDYKKIRDSYFNFNLKITSEYLIEYLNIYMIVQKDFYPLESNYNFKKIENYQGLNNNVEKDRDVYKFITPRNIGTDVFFKMAVLDQSFRMVIEVEYPYISFSNIYINVPNGMLNKRSFFIETIDVNQVTHK